MIKTQDLGSGTALFRRMIGGFRRAVMQQVYDRVIPTGAVQTLFVLSVGALIAIGLDWMARTVYLRLLAVRLDQMPRSVGSLASQMRGYESVRSFLTQVTTSVLVDMPFAFLFLAIMAMMSGALVAVPLVFFVLALGLGLSTRRRMEVLAKQGAKAGNFKTGLLVETVEGAETLISEQAPNGQSQAYYRARVRLLPQAPGAAHQLPPIALKPGLTATVDILTGQRSVLRYLIKPIARGLSGSLNQR